MKTLRLLPFLLIPAGVLRAAPDAPDALPFPQNAPAAAEMAHGKEQNLLTNPNFQKGTAGWEQINWGPGKMAVDGGERREGKATLRVTNPGPGHTFVRQVLTAKPSTRYRITGFIKTQNVEAPKTGKKTGAVLMIGRTGIYTPFLVGTKPWTKVSVEFTTKEDGEIRIGPSLGTDGVFATGTAWFSDLKLTELGGAGK